MSDAEEFEYEETPRLSLAFRFSVLGLMVLILLGILAWRVRASALQEAERTRKLAAMLAEQQRMVVPKPNWSPQGTPDFTGGTEFRDNEAPPTALQDWLEKAQSVRSQVVKRRSQTLRAGSSNQLILPNHDTLDLNRHADERYRNYRLELVERYRQLTADQGAALEAGTALLRTYSAGTSNNEELKQLAKTAIDAGSDDPLIRAWHARICLFERSTLDKLDEICLTAMQQLRSRGYGRDAAVLMRCFLYESAILRGGGKSVERIFPLVVDLVRWLEEEGIQPARRDVVYQRLQRIVNTTFNDWFRLRKACLHSTKIDPWYLHMMLGHSESSNAWLVRGHGFASEVKEDRWNDFYKHLRNASDHYECAWNLAPELPYAAAEMINVTNAANAPDDSPTDWFLRAVSARFDYAPAYTMLDNARLSRWGGSVEQLLEFGDACLATERFDTLVPYHVLTLMETIRTNELSQGNGQALSDVVDLPGMLSRFLAHRDRYKKIFPDRKIHGDDKKFYRTQLIALLAEANMDAQAAAEFEAAEGNLDYAVLQKDAKFGHYEMLLVAAAQGDVRARVRDFDRQLRQPWSPTAQVESVNRLQQELAELRPLVSQSAGAKRYIETAELVIRQLKSFVNGEMVDLDFDDAGTGWELHAETVELVSKENEARLRRRESGTDQMWARPIADFHPPFELELEFETTVPEVYRHKLGVRDSSSLVGVQWIGAILHTEYAGVRSGRSFVDWSPGFLKSSVTERMDRFYFPGDDQNTSAGYAKVYRMPRHSLRIRVWPTAYETQAGIAWGGTAFSQPLKKFHRLYFGESYPFEDRSGEIRLANVRLRRLDVPAPPSADAPPDVAAAYWKTRHESQLDEPLPIMRLAELEFEGGRPEQAMELARKAASLVSDFEGTASLEARSLFRLHRYSEALAQLKQLVKHREDPLLYACLLELACAGPESFRAPLNSNGDLLSYVTSYNSVPSAVTLAAAAVAYGSDGDFEQARDRNREAIALAREPFKSELAERQKLYEANQPFLLPPEVKAE